MGLRLFHILTLNIVLRCALGINLENRNLYHVQISKSDFEVVMQKFPHQLDVWNTEIVESNTNLLKDDPLIDATILMTPETSQELFKNGNENSILKVEKTPMDVNKMIMDEHLSMFNCRRRTRDYLTRISTNSKLVENDFFKCFRPYQDIHAFLMKLTQKYSSYIHQFKISKTIEGEIVYGYKISLNNPQKSRKAIYIQSLIHAREWLAAPTGIYAMASLLDAIIFKNKRDLKLLEMFDWYFVPVVNIDGYKYTHTSNRYWRKNRRVNAGTSYRGVDLNRNYGPEDVFCGSGASSFPGSDTYCGTSPYSEPEVSGIHNWMKKMGNTIAGAIDIHTYGHMILRPFSWTYSTIPSPHKEKMERLGSEMSDAIYSINKARYRNMRGSDLYTAAGTFLDDMYLSFNQRPSITFELRGSGFNVPASEILKAGPEIFEGLHAFANGVKNY